MTVEVNIKEFSKMLIDIMEIVAGAQIRQSEKTEKIEEYAEAMAEGWGTFPEIKVCLVDNQYKIADGHHRWEAAKRAGLKKVPCLLIGETEAELWEYAFSENVNKGISMTDEEKREAYKLAIHKFRDKSARQIAEMCRCSSRTIDRLIKQLEEKGEYKRPKKVVGKDGITRKINRTDFSTATPVAVASPPAALAGYVTCRQCCVIQPEGMTEQPDTTWRQKGLDENNKYIWLCSDDCEDKWNEAQEQALDDELAQQNAEPPKEVETKPQEPQSCLLELGMVCEVKGETDAERAFLEVLEKFPLALTESQFRVKKSSIYSLNTSNNTLNSTYTEKSREEKTRFTFKLKGGKCYTLGKPKYDELVQRYPTLDVDKHLTDCMNYYNAAQGDALLPFNVLMQRIESWLIKNRNEAAKEAERKQAYSKPSKAQQPNFSPEAYE